MKSLFMLTKTPKKMYEYTMQTLCDKWPSYSTVKKWCANFHHGDFETQDAALLGKPSTMSTPEIDDHVYHVILADRQISTKRIAETLKISKKHLVIIIHEHLGMQRLSAKRMPKCPNVDHER